MQDLPYLEQKFAALMMAVEFFTRNSLLESGAAPVWVESLTFGNLLGESRKRLGWELPKHYEADIPRMAEEDVAKVRHGHRLFDALADGRERPHLRRRVDHGRTSS